MARTSDTGTRDTGGFASTFMFIALIIGAFFGTAFGQSLDGSVSERRLLSILSALFAMMIIWLVRHFLGNAFPTVFVKPHGKSIPPAVWLGVVFSSIVGGLAGHDIGQLFGVTSGALSRMETRAWNRKSRRSFENAARRSQQLDVVRSHRHADAS